MNIFDDYFKLQQEIYDYFGFKEDWIVLPLDDCREFDWMIKDDCEVLFGKKDDMLNDWDEEERIFIGEGNYYSNLIYKQRFYNQWVYRGKEYTMIMVDTHTDGNRFLSIFDNAKEIK